MANIVSKTHYTQGTAPTAADLNEPYNDLATASGIVDESNTASSWMTYAHMDNATYQCNRLYSYSNNTTSTMNTSSTTWVTVSIGGNAAEIDLTGFDPDEFEATRFCASGLVRTHTVATDTGVDNYYAFRLLLTYDDGAGDVTTSIGQWGYSFTSRSLVTTEAGSAGDDIQFQTFQFSAVRKYSGSGGREYKKLELQVILNDGTNALLVSRHQLFVISGRR